MAEPEELDEDLFADLYEGEDTTAPAQSALTQPAPVVKQEPNQQPAAANDSSVGAAPTNAPAAESNYAAQQEGGPWGGDSHAGGQSYNDNSHENTNNQPHPTVEHDDNYGPINVKEDGKMFIGGLNWETTEQSLKDYFSQFGEVSECTVMRDSATGRSRGFGFLTFKDPKCVNTVMVKEHYLDGKIIDPKRAIPREEQERTAKIFVGGVSQEATEEDFKNFFKQFGRVIDATLMMDKDTGRPRGFGFVTFDGDAAVDATLAGPLQILGKPIEVKRAQPRGNMRDDDDKKFGRGGKFGRHDGGGGGGYDNQQNQQQQGGGGGNQMSPAMMAQYWQRMQQYFQQMQQQLAAQQGGMGGMGNPMMGAINPAMMAQMMGGGGGGPGGPGMNRQSGSPMPNPMMQMQQMQQMQMQQQQGGGQFGAGMGPGGPAGPAGGPRPAYNAQEQLAFEQQKYEQQQQRRMQQQAGYGGQGGPTSWEGMYDDIPQPSIPSGPAGGRAGSGSQSGSGGRGGRGRQGSSQPPVAQQPSNAPANAPTGPKNAGKPGANYRGGGRGVNYRHSPYGHGGR